MTVDAEEVNYIRHTISRPCILLGNKKHVIETLRGLEYRIGLYLRAIRTS